MIEAKQETVTQLPIQPQSIAIIPVQPTPIAIHQIQTNHEHLQMAQTQNLYQHKVPNPIQFQSQIQSQPQFNTRSRSKEMKTLLDLINTFPSKRRRRKSRRQRKVSGVRNHLGDSVNFLPNQLMHKNSHPTKSISIERRSFVNGNAIDNAPAVSLSENSFKKNFSNSSKYLNDFNVQSKNYKIWSPVKAENVLEAPFATSTSAGQTRMIIISSSRTISTSTVPASTVAKRPDHNNSQWKNKYNIDYDNKLEDEYEIIMKDE